MRHPLLSSVLIPALLAGFLTAAATAQDAPKPADPTPAPAPDAGKPATKADAPHKEGGGFVEGRMGDVPEGAAEQVTPETDRAIEQGLTWLAKSQNADGSFGSGGYRGNIAVTSLAGLAFMANGSSPGRGPYGSQIDKALLYVMDNTAPSGFISVPNAGTHGPMYSHGFGALFLAEAYGMSRRPELREKLTNAIRLIIDTQNGEGGWRYQPVRARRRPLGHDLPDQRPPSRAGTPASTSPGRRSTNCIRYVKQSQNMSTDGGFRYMIQGGASAFPRSAAGVVALYSASVYDADEVKRGVEYLKQFMPEIKLRPAVTATTSTAITTPRRRCGFAAGRTGTSGTRRSATNSSAARTVGRGSGPTASALNTGRRWPC